MKTPEEAIQIVDRYIANARDIMHERMEKALRDIARLPWYSLGRAQQLACKALGIGPFWDHDNPPKSLWTFWWRNKVQR